MNIVDLLSKGYFPKELPPCFITTEFAKKFNQINNDISATEATALNNILNTIQRKRRPTQAQKDEEKLKAKTIFNNRNRFSDCTHFTIPKTGLSRNTIKIPNPLHQGKLSELISANYTHILTLFDDSIISTTKPIMYIPLMVVLRQVWWFTNLFLKSSKLALPYI